MSRDEISPSYESVYRLHGIERVEADFMLRPDMLKELDPDNPDDYSDFTGAFLILTHPDNIGHFSHRLNRERPSELLAIAKRDKRHVVVAKIPKAEAGIDNDIVVGTYTINDSSNPDEQEHFMGFFGIHPNAQGRGWGRQMFESGLYKSFIETTAFTGRPRLKLFVGITVHGEHQAMEHICRSAGFSMTQRLRDQMVYFEEPDEQLQMYQQEREGQEEGVNTELIQYLMTPGITQRYDTIRYVITAEEFIRNTSTRKYSTLNASGIDEVARVRYLPALNEGLRGREKTENNGRITNTDLKLVEDLTLRRD